MSGPWEDYAPKQSGAAPWEEYAASKPKTPQEMRSEMRAKELANNPITAMRDIGMGFIRGAGSIGATGLRVLPAFMGGDTKEQNDERRQAMTAGLSSLGADTDSMGFAGGKLGGELAGTAGLGGVLGNGLLRAAPAVARYAPAVSNFMTKAAPALSSSGMVTGGAGPGLAAKAGDVALRAGAGTLVAGTSGALVNPADAMQAAIFGGVAPGIFQAAGKLGGAVFSSVGSKAKQGKILAKALGVSPEDLQAIAKAAREAPDSILPNSPLTLSQALQHQGINQPSVKILERIAAAGPGGEKLGKIYAQKSAARSDALVSQGARAYAGAAANEAENVGNQLAALLRTQADDEAGAMRAAWGSAEPGNLSGVHGRAVNEGAALQIPIVRMKGLVADRMGDGYTGGTSAAAKTIKEAERIGVETLAAIKPISQGAINKGQNLEQAVRAAGGMPGATSFTKAVPFKSFQTLRSGAGSDAAALSEKAGNEVQAGVMAQIEKIMAGRVDDAAAGNLLPGESMSTGLMQDYKAARDLTRDWHQRYEGGNAISQILRKPVGQNYTLNGNEVTKKLWHGGGGLVEDVATLKRTLSDNNRDLGMSKLREYIMTDAASQAKASGDLGSALPRYVETRMPGLQEALTPEQFKAVTGVAADIRNSDAAAALPGLMGAGSDTYAKTARAMDGGLLDSSTSKKLATLLSYKGFGGDYLREKLAGSIVQYKGRAVSELMANPKLAARALQDASFVRSLDNETAKQLSQVAVRALPILAAD